MNSYYFTPAAWDDPSEIWDWIAADNERAAEQLSHDIQCACEQLAEHPLLGIRKPGFTRQPRLRFFLVRTNYWIVYQPESKPLEILRVIHAARDVARVLATEN